MWQKFQPKEFVSNRLSKCLSKGTKFVTKYGLTKFEVKIL
jgi:hypothetical protein